MDNLWSMPEKKATKKELKWGKKLLKRKFSFTKTNKRK